MTLKTEDGKSPFRQTWVTRSGLVDQKPEENDCFTHEEAEVMADEIMSFLGLTEGGVT